MSYEQWQETMYGVDDYSTPLKTLIEVDGCKALAYLNRNLPKCPELAGDLAEWLDANDWAGLDELAAAEFAESYENEETCECGPLALIADVIDEKLGHQRPYVTFVTDENGVGCIGVYEMHLFSWDIPKLMMESQSWLSKELVETIISEHIAELLGMLDEHGHPFYANGEPIKLAKMQLTFGG